MTLGKLDFHMWKNETSSTSLISYFKKKKWIKELNVKLEAETLRGKHREMPPDNSHRQGLWAKDSNSTGNNPQKEEGSQVQD